MGKNAAVGIKIASKQTKDGNFKDVRPIKSVAQCPYTNPSKAVAKGMEHKVGKLG